MRTYRAGCRPHRGRLSRVERTRSQAMGVSAPTRICSVSRMMLGLLEEDAQEESAADKKLTEVAETVVHPGSTERASGTDEPGDPPKKLSGSERLPGEEESSEDD